MYLRDALYDLNGALDRLHTTFYRPSTAKGRVLHLDYETACNLDLTKVGLDRYTADPSCRILMVAWSWDSGDVQQWTCEDGTPFPQEVIDGLLDPDVEKWAFNAQFERVVTRRVLKVNTPYRGWRCTMVLAYMQSFVGKLDQIGGYVGLPEEQQKLKRGKFLIRLFCGPNKPTKNNPLVWRNAWTHPEEWEEFCLYNRQDVVAERAIKSRLIKFYIPPEEWELYEIDQETNDRGLPIDMVFVENAIIMADRRKAQLTAEMVKATGLANPNSPAQLIGWLKERGYPFGDLRADTVKKVLTENEELIKEEGSGFIGEDVVAVMKMRQQVARTSVKKYNKLRLMCVDLEGNGQWRFRFGFQQAGAQRTWRAAGRGLNPQNLTRTPKEIEPDDKLYEPLGLEGDHMLAYVTKLIRDGDYDMLCLTVKEPMDALAGTVRSAIAAPEGEIMGTCDLSSIETCVIAMLSGCTRLLNVFRNKQDPYIDFAKDLYSTTYELVTKRQRQEAKPAVLGSGFRLGGGELRDGKRTGLWGYAESMGVNMTKEQAAKATKLFRESYPEIPQLWYAFENAVVRAIRGGTKTSPIITMGSKRFVVPIMFEMKKPYLIMWLPNGSPRYYYKPRIHKETRYTRPTPEYPEGKPYQKEVFTYIGREQGKNVFKRIATHGGKITENAVQAFAREILMHGYRRAAAAGYEIIGHVHDELMWLMKKGESVFTVAFMRLLMIQREDYMGDLPLNAAGSEFAFYRKD